MTVRANTWGWQAPAVLLVLFQLVTVASAAKLYLCGDSTMAKGNGKIDGKL
jgi:hypothetical protein